MATVNPRSALEQVIDEMILLCPICKDRMVKPKILPCVHTFCEKCLTQWVTRRGGILECPTCRQASPLPEKGVEGLNSNLFIIDLIDIFNNLRPVLGETPCDICDSKGVCWCKECAQFFCSGCRRFHEKTTATMGHALMTTGEFSNMCKNLDVDRVIRPRFCAVHEDSRLELFCDLCQTTACMRCAVTEHKATAHKLLSLGDALEKYTPELQALLDGLSTRVQSLHEKKREAELSIGRCDEKHHRGRQKVKQLRAHLDQIYFDLGCIESISAYARNLLQHGSAVDVLSQKREMEKGLMKIGHFHQPFRPGQFETPYTETPVREQITCNMPDGSMDVVDCGTYSRIDYVFDDGIQKPEHPHPGQPYQGRKFSGFILNDDEGREVLRLLKIAFDRRLTFTISPVSNEVEWNGITHIQYLIFNDSYRRPYLKRVREELAAKGVV